MKKMEYTYKIHALIDDFKDDAIAYYNNNATLQEVGIKYGVCAETVRRRFAEWNVKLRIRTHTNSIKALNTYRQDAIVARRKISNKGEHNPKWKGGISTPYFKQRVLARDGRRCRLCGYDEHPEIIEVDHINSNHSDNRIENGWALCPNCHRIEEFKRGTFATKWRAKRYV